MSYSLKAKPTTACTLCGVPGRLAGQIAGRVVRRDFRILSCEACRFYWVQDPVLDDDLLYAEPYYRKKGADLSVDYMSESEHFETTVRRYEWQGLVRLARMFVPVTTGTRWLDYGCGHGGLVRYVRATEPCAIWGSARGWIAGEARARGVPLVDEGSLEPASFDIVSCVEVLEHVADPLPFLAGLRRLLKPGGLLLLTTGNTAPFYRPFRLFKSWSYAVPDIHLSYFTPKALAIAFARSGFEPRTLAFSPGHVGLYRYRILKSLGQGEVAAWQAPLPWRVMARVADQRYQLSRMPVAVAI